MDQLLEKLFESIPKVRLLRLFMQNPDTQFTFPQIVDRTRVSPTSTRSELGKLERIRLIKEKESTIRLDPLKHPFSKKKNPIRTKSIMTYFVNPDFPFLSELRDLVIKSSVASRKRLVSQIKALGRVKLAVISGVFINNDRARTDLLIVGDDIGRKRVENFLAQVESELGKSVSYTLMDLDEFKYRMNMYDRFLRDILEFPHEKLINKVNI